MCKGSYWGRILDSGDGLNAFSTYKCFRNAHTYTASRKLRVQSLNCLFLQINWLIQKVRIKKMIRNIGLPFFLIGLLDVCPLLAFRFWGAVLQLAPSKSWSNWSSSPKFQIWANDIGISKIIRRANYQMGSTDKRMDYYQRIHCCWLSWWNRPRKCPLYFYLLSHNRGLDGDLQPLGNIFSWTDIRQPHQLL